MDATATLWDVAGGRAIKVLHGHKPHTSVTDVVFSPDGKTPPHHRVRRRRPVVGGAVGRADRDAARPVRLADLRRLQPGRPLDRDRRPELAVLWPTETGQLLFYLRGHTDQLSSVAFSPNGWQVLTSSKDGSVRVYDCQVCAGLGGLERLAEKRLQSSGLGG